MTLGINIKKVSNFQYNIMDTQTLSDGFVCKEIKIGEILFEKVLKKWFYVQKDVIFISYNQWVIINKKFEELNKTIPKYQRNKDKEE